MCNRYFFQDGSLKTHMRTLHHEGHVFQKFQVIPQKNWLTKSLPNLEDFLATIPSNSLVSREEELESENDFEDIMCEVKNVKVDTIQDKNPTFK